MLRMSGYLLESRMGTVLVLALRAMYRMREIIKTRADQSSSSSSLFFAVLRSTVCPAKAKVITSTFQRQKTQRSVANLRTGTCQPRSTQHTRQTKSVFDDNERSRRKGYNNGIE